MLSKEEQKQREIRAQAEAAQKVKFELLEKQKAEEQADLAKKIAKQKKAEEARRKKLLEQEQSGDKPK